MKVLLVLSFVVAASRCQPCTEQDFGIAYNGVKVFSVSRSNQTCSCLNYASPGVTTLRAADVGTLQLGTLLGGPGGVRLPAGTILDLGFDASGREFDAGKIGYGAFGWTDSLTIVGAGPSPGSRQVKLVDKAVVGSLVSIGGTYDCGGLQASYYQNLQLEEPAACRQRDSVFLHWPGSGPCGSCGSLACTAFSVRWDGYLLAPTTGNLTLSLSADDGLRLWWNNGQQPLIDGWRVQNSTNYAVVVSVVSGIYYPIRLEYFQDTGPYSLIFQWFYPAQPPAAVPASSLCSASALQVTAGSSAFNGPVTFNGPALFSYGFGAPATPTDVNGPLSISGLATASGGLLVPTGKSLELEGSAALRVAGVATFNVINATQTATASLAVSGLTTAGGGLTVPTGQTVAIQGTSTLSVGGGITASGGVVVPGGQAVSLLGSATLSVAGTSTLGVVNSGPLTVTGALSVSGGTTAGGGITVPTGQAVALQGTSTLSVGGTLTAAGGITVLTGNAVSIQGSSTLTVQGLTTASGGLMVPTGQAVSLQGSTTLSVGGSIAANGGLTVATGQSLSVQGSGTLSVSGVTTLGVVNSGNLGVTGTLTVSATANLNGAVNIQNGILTLGAAGLRTPVAAPIDTAYTSAVRESNAGKIGYQLFSPATLGGNAPFSYFVNVDLGGYDITSGVQSSAAACATWCAQTSGCTAFVFSPSSPATYCWLKSPPVGAARSSASSRNLGFLTGALDIVGAGPAIGGNRQIKLWDDVVISGGLTVAGSMTAASKSFLHDHPHDPSKQIVYVALEGGEHGTYARGSATLVDGRATVDLPLHFGLVTQLEGLTAQVTPRSPACFLYVETVTNSTLVVGSNDVIDRSKTGPAGNECRFDWEVKGRRIGFDDHEPIIDRGSFNLRSNQGV